MGCGGTRMVKRTGKGYLENLTDWCPGCEDCATPELRYDEPLDGAARHEERETMRKIKEAGEKFRKAVSATPECDGSGQIELRKLGGQYGVAGENFAPCPGCRRCDPCPTCGGSKEVVARGRFGAELLIRCSTCGGTGRRKSDG